MGSINFKRQPSTFGRFGPASSSRQSVSFLGAVGTLCKRCRSNGERLAIVLLEPTAAGSNLTSGSPDRDALNSWFSEILLSLLRHGDQASPVFAGRFAVALPGYGEAEARAFVDRCRRTIQLAEYDGRGLECAVRVSAGISHTSSHAAKNGYQLLQYARIALQCAKRNQLGGTSVWRSILDAGPGKCAGPLKLAQSDLPLQWYSQEQRCESTEALIAAVDAKDPYTQSHSRSVAHLAEAIGRRMKLSEREVQTIRNAALLHDIGKIGIPDAILTKPGPLTDDEFEIIKSHPEIAVEILKNVSGMSEERLLILHHHERYDGTGYPKQLKGDRIPLGSRILSVADALDTMLSPRSYKKPFTLDHARQELQDRSGGQFDPRVIDEILRLLDEGLDRVAQPDPGHFDAVDSRTRRVSVPASV